VAASADDFNTPSYRFKGSFFTFHYQLKFLLKQHTVFNLASHHSM